MPILQEWQLGRPLEIDLLTESIAAIRERPVVATPTIDEVYALLRLRASSASAAR